MVLGIYGSGGAGREVKEIAVELNQWEEVVFIDDAVDADVFKGIRRMSFYRFQEEFSAETAEVVIALGEPKTKILLYHRVKDGGFKFGNVIHHSAWVSPTATLGKGVVLRAGVVINADAVIEDNVTVMEQSCIGHDVILRKHCQISGYVIVGGGSEIGEGTYIGLSVPVKDHIRVGSNAIVGMGSVVVREIPDNVIAMGNPARAMKVCDDSKVFK